mmetsp:Transcript_49413/g.124436  ORF Transcript_49413/g.124436 Transcript_49413/m.124436 type:complete len:261 (-) Transcript_49413:1096-1878(-)
MRSGVLVAIKNQVIVTILHVELRHVELADLVADVAVLTRSIRLRPIRAGDAAIVMCDTWLRRVHWRRKGAGGREGCCWDGQRILVYSDFPRHCEISRDARCNSETTLFSPVFTPRVLAEDVALPPADGLHSVVRIRGPTDIVDATGVGHERIVCIDAVRDCSAGHDGHLHLMDPIVVRLQHQVVLTHAARIEFVLLQRTGVSWIALLRASRCGLRGRPMLCVVAAAEVRVAARCWNARMVLDVLEDVVLPAAHAAIPVHA